MAERHVFHRAMVTRIVKETADSRTYVLVPEEQPFSYRAGQFCTFKVTVDGEELYRSYSMSSAPETDTEVMTTVKRVTRGKVSNWIIDNVVEGDRYDVTSAEVRSRLMGLDEHHCEVTCDGETTTGILQPLEPDAYNACARGRPGWRFLE